MKLDLKGLVMAYGLLALVLFLSGQLGPKMGDRVVEAFDLTQKWEAEMLRRAENQPDYTRPTHEIPLAYFFEKRGDGVHMVSTNRKWATFQVKVIFGLVLLGMAGILWVERPYFKEAQLTKQVMATWERING